MTRKEIILQKKATALNAIRKLYHPLAKPLSCCWQEGETQVGRRDEEVERIIKQLEKELLELKQKG
jgi:hypothetical protein